VPEGILARAQGDLPRPQLKLAAAGQSVVLSQEGEATHTPFAAMQLQPTILHVLPSGPQQRLAPPAAPMALALRCNFLLCLPNTSNVFGMHELLGPVPAVLLSQFCLLATCTLPCMHCQLPVVLQTLPGCNPLSSIRTLAAQANLQWIMQQHRKAFHCNVMQRKRRAAQYRGAVFA
jgi:hypothetical protein